MSTETDRPDSNQRGTGDDAEGLTIVARTQGQLVRQRFFRHRAALGGMLMLTFVIVLAVSSIGFGPVPGWWDKSYLSTASVVDGGRPTLSVLPTFLGGDGVHLGEHPLGQDDIGKDYFALVMRGTQQSLVVAFLIGIVSTVIGAVVGATAGFYRGRTEAILMRITDVVIAIPLLVFAAILAAVAGRAGIVALGVAIGAVLWTNLARLLRGEFLSLREKEFVEAARASGTKSSRIIFKHIMPNTMGIIVVSATLATATGILIETALSYLGLGIQPPDVSLGSLVQLYETAMLTRPWLFWWPGVFIVAVALSVNFIGDGLRDAFDPRQTRVRE